MEEIINNCKEANIICPNKRIYEFYLYAKCLINLKKIYFNNNINKSCEIYLVDQECIDKIKDFSGKNNKFIVFFWNGQFDYDLYFNKKIIENNQNILPLIIGNSTKIQTVKFDKVYLDNKTKISGLGIIRLLDIKFTFLKFILRFFLYPIYTIKNLCFDKLIFVGIGTLKEYSYFEKTFENSNKDLVNIFKDYSQISNIEDKEKYLNSLQLNEKFKKLKMFEKCYFLQSIFRDILIKKLLKFKNFKCFSNDKKLSIQRSFLFKNNYFLDPGSKVGGDYYNERTITYMVYNKKFLRVSFFSHEIIDDKSFNSKINLMYKFLKKIGDSKKINLPGKDLANEIQNLYLQATQNKNEIV